MACGSLSIPRIIEASTTTKYLSLIKLLLLLLLWVTGEYWLAKSTSPSSSSTSTSSSSGITWLRHLNQLEQRSTHVMVLKSALSQLVQTLCTIEVFSHIYAWCCCNILLHSSKKKKEKSAKNYYIITCIVSFVSFFFFFFNYIYLKLRSPNSDLFILHLYG